MKIILCNTCQKQRKNNSGATFTKRCISCTLKANRVMLLKCFQSIVDQPDMKQFKVEMEQWYV